MKNSGDSVFGNIAVGQDEPTLAGEYLAGQDFSANTRRAVIQDLRKFAAWFSSANAEPFRVGSCATSPMFIASRGVSGPLVSRHERRW